ncbi:manganese catalase family protein [Falsiroseomonas sp.]|uniref:manganese catalase family protein n=1 Tax=Falsiroseomonas sp. TaxID=2870721 RepID=UPI003563D802
MTCTDSLGNPWRGDYIFNSGNLVLDLLHNFFLENGARTAKLRAYQTTSNPAARRMLGYLFTRGGVHAHAYALALEQLTGVDMKKMLPIPNLQPEQIPESRPFLEEGWHRRLYRFSMSDYDEIRANLEGRRPGRLRPARGARRPAGWRRDAAAGSHAGSLHPGLPPAGDPGDGAEALPEGQGLSAV